MEQIENVSVVLQSSLPSYLLGAKKKIVVKYSLSVESQKKFIFTSSGNELRKLSIFKDYFCKNYPVSEKNLNRFKNG